MIFPEDYKSVGITRSDPGKKSQDEPMYFATKYLIAYKPNNECAIFEVESTGEGLFRKVSSLKPIASGREIVRYEKEMDRHDRTALIEIAHSLCRGEVNTVIFTRVDKHVTFVHKPDLREILEIEVIDIIPPEPPWLSLAIQGLIKGGILGELTVKFTTKLIDLRRYEGKDVVFPCNASGLKGKYLDSDIIDRDNTVLVGCDISKEIFDLRFPRVTYKLINICPLKARLYKPTEPFITRCCQSKKSGMININGIDGAVVHWGASEFDILEAIRSLVKILRGGS